MDKQEELRQWFKIADDNLDSAEFLFANRHPLSPDEIVCNLSQQAAEKYLKGFLVLRFVVPLGCEGDKIKVIAGKSRKNV